MLLFVPFQLTAAVDGDSPSTSPTNVDVESARINTLIDRLYEIDGMDIPAMSFTEKKELRKEVRSIRSELKAFNADSSNPPANIPPPAVANGVYISVGGILLIALLLILLL